MSELDYCKAKWNLTLLSIDSVQTVAQLCIWRTYVVWLVRRSLGTKRRTPCVETMSIRLFVTNCQRLNHFWGIMQFSRGFLYKMLTKKRQSAQGHASRNAIYQFLLALSILLDGFGRNSAPPISTKYRQPFVSFVQIGTAATVLWLLQ